MKFGSRKDQPAPAPVAPAAQAPEVMPARPAATSVTHISEPPVLPSKRLQRMAEFFRAHSDLLEQMTGEFQREVQPLSELLVTQSQTMQRLLTNLEDRLRPLNEYADGEEANLEALQQRMHQQHSDFVSRSFSDYLTQQRQRITETREQIDQQRLPFLKYAEDQRDTIEVALSHFDQELDELEKNLGEQRRRMTQVLETMRSESFVTIRNFLERRQEALSQLAASGNTDPGDISRSVRALREAVEEMANSSTHVKTVLDATDEADARLSKATPAPSNQLPPELAAAVEEQRGRVGSGVAA